MNINLIEETLEVATQRTHSTKEREIKRIVEALLFASSEPVALPKLKEIIQTQYPIRSAELRHVIDTLSQEYKNEGHTFEIAEIAGGYLLRTVEEMYPFIELLHQDRRSEKLSRPATEVLAIIAYRQPITRREMEEIRGVDCSGTVVSLIERGLIEAVGRKEAPGRPIQYVITKRFLQHFGLKDLEALRRSVVS
ncbi:MAG: Segregation and condensation protein B [Chlamydiales bacterium]|nr:Segregation and condensation protein B [Chlamydiales bacterium]